MAEKLLTLGEAAERLGTQLWKVQRVFDRKRLPEPRRVGRTRVVPETDLPRVEKALREAGLMKREPAG